MHPWINRVIDGAGIRWCAKANTKRVTIDLELGQTVALWAHGDRIEVAQRNGHLPTASRGARHEDARVEIVIPTRAEWTTEGHLTSVRANERRLGIKSTNFVIDSVVDELASPKGHRVGVAAHAPGILRRMYVSRSVR